MRLTNRSKRQTAPDKVQLGIKKKKKGKKKAIHTVVSALCLAISLLRVLHPESSFWAFAFSSCVSFYSAAY
jgi:hypothetical protein